MAAGWLGAIASTAVVVVLGLRGHPGAVGVGAIFSGATALTCGLLLLRRARPWTRREAFRPLLAGAVALWGVGQLILASQVMIGDRMSFPTVGGLVATAAGPLAIAGLFAVPRLDESRTAGVRLVLDALLVAVATLGLLWQVWFRSVILPGFAWADAVTLGMALVDVTLLAVAALACLRDRPRGLGSACLGLTLFVAADLYSLHEAAQPGSVLPWQAAALWCLSWPLIAAGVTRFDPASTRPGSGRYSPDDRMLVATTVLFVVMLALTFVRLGLYPDLEWVTISMALLLITVFALREAAGARLRSSLLNRLRDQARRDPLTGLGNRRMLVERIAGAGDDPAVLTVDLDGFKEVNDVLGHAAGDAMLVAVARGLEAAVPAGGVVTRIGGDEFAVLVPGGIAAGAVVAELLLEATRAASARVPGAGRVVISASVGVGRVAREPEVGPGRRQSARDPLAVLSESGFALRAAKAAGRDRVEVYGGATAAAHQRRLILEQRLTGALRTGALDVHYQPVVDLANGHLAGVEALLRWTDEVLGQVPPLEFVGVAEQTGLVVPLGEFVLRRAVADARAAGTALHGENVGVNVSPVQLRTPGFDVLVAQVLAEHALPASTLVVEVTEAIFVDAEDPAVSMLRRLADTGVRIAIDDFGTGYSALGYLRTLPVHILKLDRSLTASLGEPTALEITRAVVDLGSRIGLTVVAEGIETLEQARLVSGLGASHAQGWLFGRPAPARALPSFLRTYPVPAITGWASPATVEQR